MSWEPITTVDQLVARFETSSLDYKTTYDLTTKATRYEIAKDVAAFANAYGGAIVVGVQESGGKAVKLEGVVDVARLTREVATAIQQHCVPCPSTPEEKVIVVTSSDALRLLSEGCPAPAGPVTLVTLNVRPDPRGPIGVKPYEVGTQAMADTFRFPVRIDDQTRCMPPTELPMWMNSHERRIALQLRRIPANSIVRVFQRHKGDYANMNFIEVDESQGIASFVRPGNGQTNVPLSYVGAVWLETRDSFWSVKVNGTLFRNTQFTFDPEG